MNGFKFLCLLQLLALANAELQCSKLEELKEKKDDGFSYICWHGQWQAWACRVPGDGTVVIAGQKFIAATGSILYECGWLSATQLQLKAIACLTNDKVIVYPMQELTANGYTLTCMRRGVTDLSWKVEADPSFGRPRVDEIGFAPKSMPDVIPPTPPPVPTSTPSKTTSVATTTITTTMSTTTTTRPVTTPVPPKVTGTTYAVTAKTIYPMPPALSSLSKPQPQPQVLPMASPLVSAQNQSLQKPSPTESQDQCLFDGKSYPVGATMELSGAWYTCTKTIGNPPEPTLTGCVAPTGTKYRLGERSENKFFAFRCDPLQGNMAVLNGYACIERYPNGTTAELPIGRRWLVGAATKNSRYIMQCSSDGAFNIRRQAVLCFYNTTYGIGVLTGGCMLNVGDVLVQCMPHSRMWPNVRVRVKENPSSTDRQKIESEGDLKYCNGSPLPTDVLL